MQRSLRRDQRDRGLKRAARMEKQGHWVITTAAVGRRGLEDQRESALAGKIALREKCRDFT
jgi:hypothetical protein